MSIATADLHEALNTAWDDSGMDSAFTDLWSDDYSTDDFPVLHDREATPGQPTPYCVVEIDRSRTTARMSDGDDSTREIHDYPVTFTVYADNVDGDSRSPKQIAKALAEQLMRVFGGHPDVAPSQTISLTHGGHLITQYDNDYGERVENDLWSWSVAYTIRVDVPLAW